MVATAIAKASQLASISHAKVRRCCRSSERELGLVEARRERRNLEMYAWKSIGQLPLGDVRPSHVRNLLDEAIAQGRKRATVAHIHGVLRRMFSAAVADELIEQSPVAAVRVPKMRPVRKERVILNDVEFAQFVGCAEVDLELRMLSLVARRSRRGRNAHGRLHRAAGTKLAPDQGSRCWTRSFVYESGAKRTPVRGAGRVQK